MKGKLEIGGTMGLNFGNVTACYWNESPAEGIGDDRTRVGQTTKVDGTNVKWAAAVVAMNTVLQSAGSGGSTNSPEHCLH